MVGNTVTAKELAHISKKHYHTILRWAKKGKIPCRRSKTNRLKFNMEKLRKMLLYYNSVEANE